MTTLSPLEEALTGAVSPSRFNRRFVTHGDSFCSLGMPTLNADNKNWDISQIGIFGWADALSGGRIEVVYDGGVGGQTSAQIASAARISTTLSYKPGLVFENGGTNDLLGSVTAAQIISNRLTVWDAFLQAGCGILAMTLPPRGGMTTAQLIKANVVNAQLRSYARRYQARGYQVVIVDLAAAMTNPDTGISLVSGAFGAIDDMVGIDLVHGTATGFATGGQLLADAASAIIPPVSWNLPQGGTTNIDLAYDATNGYVAEGNLVANGKMSGTGGTSTHGSVANGWAENTIAAPAGGGTVTFSKVNVATGLTFGTWQQIAIAPGSSGNVGTAFLFSEAVVGGYAAGDVIRAVCRFETDAANWCGSDGLSRNNISLELNCVDSGFATLAGARCFPNLGATNGRFRPPSGVLRTPDVTIPANTAHIYAWLRFFGVGTMRFTDVQSRRSAYL